MNTLIEEVVNKIQSSEKIYCERFFFRSRCKMVPGLWRLFYLGASSKSDARF